jgi:hypothetical protein
MTDHVPKEAKGGVFSNADIPLIKSALLSYARTLEDNHPDMKKISLLVHRLGRIAA